MADSDATLRRLESEIAVLKELLSVQERTTLEQADRLETEKQRAQEASKAKGRFLANMSHEIRTPLNGVIGMTGILCESDLTPDQLSIAHTIDTSGRNLLDVLNDILDFSKIEAGELQLETGSFLLSSLVEDVLDLHAARAKATNIELAGLVASDLPLYVIGDGGRLRQVLNNLVSNAIKFSPAGEVTVHVDALERSEEEVLCKVAVRDNGAGIDREVASRLFEPFTQADESTSRTHGGTGLGLAICKELVELMGGEIAIESVLGEGSTVWFAIPLGIDQDMAEGRENDLGALPVLVVDDNETNRSVLCHYLTTWNAIPSPSVSGPEALGVLRAAARAGRPFKLALLDMQMPGMDGMELAKTIRDDPSVPSPSMILLTSVGQMFPETVLREVGVMACLSKPIRARALLAKINDALTDRSGRPITSVSSEVRPEYPSGTRVLIAEDNSINQRVTMAHMKRLGLEADVAGNGEEVLAASDRRAYDLILMDCHMPVMDGYEATRAIRRKPGANQQAPIVALTASTLKGDRERCRDSGMNDYLAKPFTTDSLAAVVSRWLAPAQPVRPQEAAAPADADAPVFDLRAIGSLQKLAEASGDASLVRGLLDGFAEHAPERLHRIRGASVQGDSEQLEQEAHALKGSAGAIGARKLQHACQDLESAACEGQEKSWDALVTRLEDALQVTLENLPRDQPGSG